MGKSARVSHLIFMARFWTEEGVYVTVLNTDEGCDSTVTLFLEIESIYIDTITEIVLYGEIFQGVEILGRYRFYTKSDSPKRLR